MGDTSQLSAGFLLPLLPRSVSARGRSVEFPEWFWRRSGRGGSPPWECCTSQLAFLASWSEPGAVANSSHVASPEIPPCHPNGAAGAEISPWEGGLAGNSTCVSSAPPLSFPSDNSCFSAWSKASQMLEDKLVASFGVILAWIFLFHFFKSFPARRPYLCLSDAASWPAELQFHI